MLKSPTAVPTLLEAAKQVNELPRIREHALRVAVVIDAGSSCIEVMARGCQPDHQEGGGVRIPLYPG
ncbi:MAG: hypothetical protein U0361_05485 [Nitrospiraceae bacterium]